MESEKYIYQRNIRLIKEFYNSDYYKTLEETLRKNLINVIYMDPDYCDKLLYKNLSEKLQLEHVDGRCKLYNDNQIGLSSDAVCGWKQLYNLREGKIEWLKDYEEMISCTNAYLIWPCHKAPTINTLRYAIFKDRVDYTLYDISKFFYYKKFFHENYNKEKFEENVVKNCKLYKAYLNNNGTYNWLMSFEGFEEFIDKMCLGIFVNSEYEVINIEYNNVIVNYNGSYSFNETYLKNLKIVINNN